MIVNYKIQFKLFVIPIILLALIAGCAGPKETVQKPAEEEENDYYYDESFDPLTLDDEDLVIEEKPEKKSEDTAKKETSTRAKDTDPKDVMAFKEVDGYRVQILATKNLEKATVTQQTVMNQFAKDSIKAYLKFDAPLYKVRIGDTLKRSAAEELRDKAAKKFGYDGAFVVRSKVIVPRKQLMDY